ncbi:peptide chain release factor N(5)-glutamine methyltransferase [Alkalibacillus haloalkaliphilus]|uniref:peptide chain release factor N(5)-glutamine methyltransferase n=1 Tax=Alkalibacillus haloalkaliphilus TaxID=94136 RepID=UPI0002E27978|nr:peptide chain release factor N(5)-glutamine methyltransferase [Alkalibacillus haloalkaliphilus]
MAKRTVREARTWASSFLKEHNREERVAVLLLRYLLGVNQAQFLAMQTDFVDAHIEHEFISWIKDHAESGKPIEHFTNEVEFYDRSFYVDGRVLIPRPETEELIVALLNEVKNPQTVIDLGTGSGIIAITLKKEWPEAKVYASDLSEEALSVAHINSQKLGTDVQFEEGDFLKPFINEGVTPDVVVSNPPYIPYAEREHLSETVSFHDPSQALFAEDGGLAAYETIVSQVMQLPQKPELTAFEIGYDQAETVPNLIKKYDTNAQVKVIQDINGKDRIVLWK